MGKYKIILREHYNRSDEDIERPATDYLEISFVDPLGGRVRIQENRTTGILTIYTDGILRIIPQAANCIQVFDDKWSGRFKE